MRTALLSFILTIAGSAFGQSIEQWVTWGDAAFAREEYYGASRFYAGALEVDSGRMSVQWKQAEACRLSHQYPKAAALYEKIHRKDQGRTHRDALRWLGEMQLCNGEYSAAEATWRKVLQKEKDKNSVVAQRAQNAVQGCSLARDTAFVKSGIHIEHLPQPVNSYDSEFGARIGPDSMLYFTSLRGELNKDEEVKDTAAYHAVVFRSGVNGSPAPVVVKNMNGPGDNANAAWSLDGKWFLFTRCTLGGGCRIHVAALNANGMAEAQPLPGIGTDVQSTQPMIAHWADREMLLFASDRPGGEGGWDLWQAEWHDGSVSNAYPIGRTVNTPGNERCPWYDSVTNTLWYSSDFLPGLGGYDIFSAAFGNDIFATPVNAGLPINSPANDLYPVFDPKRGEGWLTSNRIGSFAAKGATCCNDLYRFELPKEEVHVIAQVPEEEPVTQPVTVTGRLLTLQNEFPLTLYFHNDEPDPRSWEVRTQLTYGETYAKYKALLPEYITQNQDPLPIQTFFADKVDAGFYKLTELCRAMLPVLDQGHSVVLEVRGHASPLARNDYNKNLSSRRIESLRNHLRVVDNEVFTPYLTGKSSIGNTLTIREVPFGEEQAARGVSDELRDLKRSVYSAEAANERRIEVLSIGLERVDTSAMGLRIEQQVGPLQQNEERKIPFTLTNTGTRPLHLVKSEASCGCTTAKLPTTAIAPGASAVVEVSFNGRAPAGPLTRTVTVETDGLPFRYELVLSGTVVP